MARYEDAVLTTSLVPAGEWLPINQPISSSMINLVKIKVVPNSAGGTSRFQVFKRGTFLEMDKLYDTREFTGSLIDPVEDYSDPMTDTPGATAERNEGSPIPYEDDDAGDILHLRIYNGDVNARTYTVTVRYENVLVPGAGGSLGDLTVGDLYVTGTLTVDGTSTFNSSIGVIGTITASANIACTYITATGGGSTFGDLTVSGYSSLNGGASIPSLNGTNLTFSGNGTLGSLNVSGTSTLASLTVNGSASMGGTTVSSLNSSGNADIGGVLNCLNNNANMNSLTMTGTFTHLPSSGFTSSGWGVTGFQWYHQTSGWCMGINVNGSVSSAFGLLLTCNPSATTYVFQAESVGYPGTLAVLGDGRVGVGNPTYSSVVMYVVGNQRPSDYVFIAERGIASDTPTARFTGNQTGGALIECQYYTTLALNIITGSNATAIDMLPRAFGSGRSGCFINLGRNTSPACAGYVN
jgi:hypothetical protein